MRDVTSELPARLSHSAVVDVLFSKLPPDVEALVRLGHEFTFQAVVPIGGLGYDLTIHVAEHGSWEIGHANREWSVFHRAMLVLGCGSPTVVKGRTVWLRRRGERRRWRSYEDACRVWEFSERDAEEGR